jgi:septal ring factor EnvC (AmiA/AmiB activator)
MQIGLLAQEVEAVFPDWVSTGPDGLKMVTERSTTAIMVEAMRDLRNEKDAQLAQRDAMLAQRDAKLEELAARMEKLEALLASQAATPASARK